MKSGLHKSIGHVLQIVYLRLNGTLEAIVHNHSFVGASQHFVYQWIIDKLTAVQIIDLIHYTLRFYGTHDDTQCKGRCHLDYTESVEYILARNFAKVFYKIVIAVGFH